MDLRNFRIRNRSLVIGLLIIWPALAILGQRLTIDSAFICISATSLILGFSNVIGMGDVKLLIFLAPWLHRENLFLAASIALTTACLQLLINLVVKRQLPQQVALAPAILIASALNMAT